MPAGVAVGGGPEGSLSHPLPADHVPGGGLHAALPASSRGGLGCEGGPWSGPLGLGGGRGAPRARPTPTLQASLPALTLWGVGSASSARWRQAAAYRTPAATDSLRASPFDSEGWSFLH